MFPQATWLTTQPVNGKLLLSTLCKQFVLNLIYFTHRDISFQPQYDQIFKKERGREREREGEGGGKEGGRDRASQYSDGCGSVGFHRLCD